MLGLWWRFRAVGLKLGVQSRLRGRDKDLPALLLAFGHDLVAVFGPDPFASRGWARHDAVGIFPVLFCRRGVPLILLVLLTSIVDVALDDVDVWPLFPHGIHDLGGRVPGVGHLLQSIGLFLGHLSQGGMCAEILGGAMVMLLVFGFHPPEVIFQDSHDHERASHEPTIATFALPLGVGDVSTIFVMTSTVAFEPEPIDARARDDDGVALMSCPGLDMVH